MNKNLQVLPTADLPEDAKVIHQNGYRNTQIAHANNVNTVINLILPAQRPIGGVVNAGFELCMDHYNLFVIGDESFEEGYFIVPKDRALTESMSPESQAQFSSLSAEAISQIKTFPALFASENHQYGRTDASHQARYGFVTDIKIQDNGIKVYFNPLSAVPQQRLNEIASELGLRRASMFNELNRTHWAIKRVNLIEALKKAGISVLVPT